MRDTPSGMSTLRSPPSTNARVSIAVIVVGSCMVFSFTQPLNIDSPMTLSAVLNSSKYATPPLTMDAPERSRFFTVPALMRLRRCLISVPLRGPVTLSVDSLVVSWVDSLPALSTCTSVIAIVLSTPKRSSMSGNNILTNDV